MDVQLASSLSRLKALPALAQLAIVAGGYIAALLLAVGAVWISISLTSGPIADASSGMYAFADTLLSVAVFGGFSTIPTGLALFFLSRWRKLWIALCVVALAVTTTGLAAVVVIQLDFHDLAFQARLWPGLSALRLLLSPPIALSLGLSALVAPAANLRWCLLGAAGLSSVYGLYHWMSLVFWR